MEDETVKSKVQLKKEAKKAEKMAKFSAKLQKTNFNAISAKSNAKKDFICETYAGDTESGGMKDLSYFPLAYSPTFVEACWYEYWNSNGYFKPEYTDGILEQRYKVRGEAVRSKFVMVMPPPNVTGKLHLGHALTTAIEDALTRWHRQRGDRTLWVPGCDHAGIATQVVVEKRLLRTRQLTRHDLGREKFVEEVWKWKNENGVNIFEQLRALGASCDWDRARFTMDDMMSHGVEESFIELFKRGLIYRAERLVNWSCALRSTVSDIEVNKESLPGRTMLQVPGYAKRVEFGVLHSFAYEVIGDNPQEIVVATTRIETMLGDTAVAVHPDDDRYRQLVGKCLRHPFFPARRMVIVADDYVDRDFGTGAVKITPAHDANDFELGDRHQLPRISILNDQGLIDVEDGCRGADGAPSSPFQGMPRFKAREAVLDELKRLGLYRGVEENPGMSVPICSRSKDVIEPRLMPQWYLRCSGRLSQRALAAIENRGVDGEVENNDNTLTILPTEFRRTWSDWLSKCRDWCISRQLWWGHRIPAYRIHSYIAPESGQRVDLLEDDIKHWVCARNIDEAREEAVKLLNLTTSPVEALQLQLEQDTDVLDTWYSSQLFPFSVFGWPHATDDMQNYYPTSILETGHDILFFWVARMVMIGLELTDRLPFHTIYLHAMVRDAHGKKMSKSLGNVLDPIDVIHGISLQDLQEKLLKGNLDPKELERAKTAQSHDFPSGIPACGTDGLRFALCAYTGQPRDINLDVLRVQAYRLFCNKLWQACKYLLHHALHEWRPAVMLTPVIEVQDPSTILDAWILHRLAVTVDSCNKGFLSYDLSRVTTSLYDFWLYDFCDYYLEYSKTVCREDEVASGTASADACRRTLFQCVSTGLLLLHPLMPFISEELHHRLPTADGKRCSSACITPYPEACEYQHLLREGINQQFLKIIKPIINGIRSLRASFDVPSSRRAGIVIELKANETVNVEAEEETGTTVQHILAEPSVRGLMEFITKSSIEVVNKTALASHYVSRPLSSTINIHMLSDGLFDPVKQLDVIHGKLQRILPAIHKLEREQSTENYQTKVSAEVRKTNGEKLLELHSSKEEYCSRIVQLRSLLPENSRTWSMECLRDELNFPDGHPLILSAVLHHHYAELLKLDAVSHGKVVQWLSWIDNTLVPCLSLYMEADADVTENLEKVLRALDDALMDSNCFGTDAINLAGMLRRMLLFPRLRGLNFSSYANVSRFLSQ